MKYISRLQINKAPKENNKTYRVNFEKSSPEAEKYRIQKYVKKTLIALFKANFEDKYTP